MSMPFHETIEAEVPKESVVISVGLPGSWKTPVTEAIAQKKSLQILRSDLIRLEVLKGLDIFDNKVASSRENRQKVYDEMFRRAEQAMEQRDGGILMDATFFTQELRARAASTANRWGRPLVIAECICSEEVSINRILKRTKEDYESNALTRQAYENNKAIFQPVDLDDLKARFSDLSIIYLAVDTTYNEEDRWTILKVDKR